jgi:hypothetical protein
VRAWGTLPWRIDDDGMVGRLCDTLVLILSTLSMGY